MKNASKYLKWVLIALVVGACLFGITKLWKIFSSVGTGVTNLFNNTAKEDTDDKTLLESLGQPNEDLMSITMASARVRASVIYEQFKYILGRDFDTVADQVFALNPEDLKAIFVAFGYQNYLPWGDPKNLYEWFNEELSPGEKSIMEAAFAHMAAPYVAGV